MKRKKVGNFVLNELQALPGQPITFEMDQIFNLTLDAAKQVLDFAFIADWKASGSVTLQKAVYSDSSLSGVTATGKFIQKEQTTDLACALSFVD